MVRIETEHNNRKSQPKGEKISGFFKKFLDQVGLIIENLKKDKQLLLVACCVVALIAAGVVIIVLNSSQHADDIQALADTPGGSDSDKADGSVVVAEVLPQQRRSDGVMEDGSWVPVNQYVDPFAEPIKLTGVAIGGSGGPMAIIESGGNSYIVKVGDYVDDLWAVLEINRETVVLRAYNQEISLFLKQPPQTRMLDDGFDNDGQEGR